MVKAKGVSGMLCLVCGLHSLNECEKEEMRGGIGIAVGK